MQRTTVIALVVVAILGLFLGGCAGLGGKCSFNQIDDYENATADINARWGDALALADATPSVSVDTQIAELQAVRQDAGEVEVPGCVEEVHPLLLEYMDLTIEAYNAFQADEPESEWTSLFDQADVALGDYFNGLTVAYGMEEFAE